MIQFKKLIWDSDFFQKEIYRVILPEDEILSEDGFQLIRKEKNKFFYIFSRVEQPLLSNFLVDDKVFFRKMIATPQTGSITFYNLKVDDLSKLLELAYAAGRYSRFRSDVILGIKFKEMYALWLEKSLSGQIADFVLVERKNNDLLGFVTLKLAQDILSIGLIAVSSESRGMGIGSKLLAQCESLALTKKINTIVVPTQRDNKKACSFYLKSGYREWKNEFIYHINTYENTL